MHSIISSLQVPLARQVITCGPIRLWSRFSQPYVDMDPSTVSLYCTVTPLPQVRGLPQLTIEDYHS